MLLAIKQTKTYRLTKMDRLDPVTVYVSDNNEGAGKLTLDCFGKAWTVYWAAMGDRTLQEFVIEADSDYILNKMLPETYQTDFDEIEKLASAKGFSLCVANDVELAMQADDMAECFGDEWYMDLPRCHTNDYHYLGRILNAVREAFIEDAEGRF